MNEPYDWEKDPFFNATPNCSCKGEYTHPSYIHTPYLCQIDRVTFERKFTNWHKHVVDAIPGDYYKDDMWRSDRAECSICGTGWPTLGWYCPSSEDHLCYYSNSLDICDFCGMPEERK